MSDERLIRAGKAIAKRNMEVYKAGAAASGKGSKAVQRAMEDKYMEQRGGGSTMRPGYGYELGGSKEADKEYLKRK